MQDGFTINGGLDKLDFFNHIFITSLQNSFIQKPLTTPQELINQNNSLYTFYELRVIDNQLLSFEFNFKGNGFLKRVIKRMDKKNWKDIKEENEIILYRNSWRERKNSYKLIGSSIVIDELYKIDILDSKRLNQIDNIDFPADARVIKSRVIQLKDIYILEEKVKNIDLRSFILDYSFDKTFDGFKYGGVSFGEVKKGQTKGDIWYFNGLKNDVKLISKSAGKWQIKRFGDVEILIVEIKGYDKILFSNIGDTLYRGRVKKANQKEWISYNKSAFEAIKRALSL